MEGLINPNPVVREKRTKQVENLKVYPVDEETREEFDAAEIFDIH